MGYKIGLELLVKGKCQRVHEIPIDFENRHRGASKLTLAEQIRYLRHLKRLADYKYSGISQLTQFCLVGATGMLVDLVCYFLLLRGGFPVGLARGAAIFIAMNWNFALNRQVTFATAGQGQLWYRYVKFLWSCTFGGAVSWSVSVLTPALMPAFRGQLMLAALLGIAIGTLINFQLSRRWVFRR
jgi:dolichol-phosphate mannosyltransferase